MTINSPLRLKSYAFAKEIVISCHRIANDNREYVLTKQLIKSATSVGANIEEAQQPQSRKDFVSKLSISLKEAYESRYWIALLRDTKFMKKEQASKLLSDVDEIAALLSSSIGTAKKNLI